MAQKYADRAFITVNGVPVLDIQSASLKQNKNSRAVPSMTRDGFNRGFVKGNVDIDIMIQIAVLNQLARPKIDFIDFENADVGIVFVCGVEQFVCSGVFDKDSEDNAGGIGDEVKTTFNLGALRITDAVGNAAELFDISL